MLLAGLRAPLKSMGKPTRVMVVAWIVILVIIVAFCALYGGRQCKAPASGPLHAVLAGHKYVPGKSWRTGGCVEVRSDGTFFPHSGQRAK